MKSITLSIRSFLVIACFAGATLLAGCNAASLTGPEPTDVQATGGTGGTGTGTGGNGGDSHGENEPRNL